MEAPTFPSSVLQEVVNRIFASRQITRKDQYMLLSLTVLNQDERNLLNQVFDRLQKGLLRVVD